MRTYAIIILTLLASLALHAQVRPSRTWNSDVLRTPAPRGVMSTLLGGAEIQRSNGSYGGEQAWQFRTHVQAEVYRFTDSADAVQLTTTIEAHQELTANPFNDIAFNPRAMRWEEFVWFHVGLDDVSLRAGFVHRCKHDIDNINGPDERNPTSPSLAEQRTIILTGPAIGASLAPFMLGIGTLSASGGMEYFVNASDTRRTRDGSAETIGSWSTMQGACWARARYVVPLTSDIALSAQGYAALPWFTASGGDNASLPLDARGELALMLRGTAGTISIAGVVEHMFDEIVLVRPHATSFVGVMVSFMPL